MSVTLIATGGTIASTRGEGGAVTTSLAGADLLDAVVDRGRPADLGLPAVEVIDLPVSGSWNLTTDSAIGIAEAARRALECGSEGVVVTHGTDVLEETAWLTELVARDAASQGGLVFTAAMRNAGEIGADGPRNLVDALRLAADPLARSRGTLVCLNGEIHHARWVTKVNSRSLDAFASPGRGPVGEISEMGVVFWSGVPPVGIRPARDPNGRVRVGGEVAVVASHWDSDPELIDWLLRRGISGLVVEGAGTGNIAGSLVPGILKALEQAVPVVVTTRCAGGGVRPVYGGKGGFATLRAAGAIDSRGLGSGKARLMLQMALGVDQSLEAVESFFAGLDPEPGV